MQIQGLSNGAPSPFDGEYLVEYDPERDGMTADGQPLIAHIVCSRDLAEAQRFEDLKALHAEWMRVCERDPHGGRLTPGSGLNRPLTAFNIEVTKVDDA